jgi:hypothetical protein
VADVRRSRVRKWLVSETIAPEWPISQDHMADFSVDNHSFCSSCRVVHQLSAQPKATPRRPNSPTSSVPLIGCPSPGVVAHQQGRVDGAGTWFYSRLSSSGTAHYGLPSSQPVDRRTSRQCRGCHPWTPRFFRRVACGKAGAPIISPVLSMQVWQWGRSTSLGRAGLQLFPQQRDV